MLVSVYITQHGVWNLAGAEEIFVKNQSISELWNHHDLLKFFTVRQWIWYCLQVYVHFCLLEVELGTTLIFAFSIDTRRNNSNNGKDKKGHFLWEREPQRKKTEGTLRNRMKGTGEQLASISRMTRASYYQSSFAAFGNQFSRDRVASDHGIPSGSVQTGWLYNSSSKSGHFQEWNGKLLSLHHDSRSGPRQGQLYQANSCLVNPGTTHGEGTRFLKCRSFGLFLQRVVSVKSSFLLFHLAPERF